MKEALGWLRKQWLGKFNEMRVHVIRINEDTIECNGKIWERMETGADVREGTSAYLSNNSTEEERNAVLNFLIEENNGL